MYRNSLFDKSSWHLLAVAAFLLFLVLCTPKIDNPYQNPENIHISLTVAGDSGTVFHHIDDSLNLHIAIKLSNLVDFVIVDWNSSVEPPDTLTWATDEFEHAVNVRHVFFKEGERTIRVIAVPKTSSLQKSAGLIIRIGRRPTIAGSGRVAVPAIIRPDTACFLAIAASGSDTLRFAWYLNGALFPGAVKDTLYFNSITSADTGSFFCIVSNNWGMDTSDSYRLLDTLVNHSPVRMAMTSPLMESDSAVIHPSLLAIAGTASSAAGIASLTVFVDGHQAPVVGTQAWSFGISELIAGKWNRVSIAARDGSGAGDTLTAFLFLMPNVPAMSAPAVRERLCTRIDLEWRKVSPCTKYLVYRFIGAPQTLDTVIETADTSLSDTGLAPAQKYYYSCRGWYSVPGMSAIDDTTPTSIVIAEKTLQCFEKTFGGLDADNAIGVMVTPDSGFLVAGTSRSTRPGNSDIFLVRLGASGDTLWTKPYGPLQNYQAVTMRPGAKGEIVVGGGYTCVSCGMQNIASVTAFSILDGTPGFNMIRDRQDNNPAYDALRTNAGGFAYVSWGRPPVELISNGMVDTMAFACMMSATGDSLWKKYLAFSAMNSKALSVTQSGDGTLYLTGVSSLASPPIGGVPPQPNCFVAKLSVSGDSLWSRTYGTTTTYTKGAQIRPTSDGGFIIAGETALIGLPRDIYLLKITAAGAQQWTGSYGTAGEDFGAQVVECSDGGFALAGGSYGATGSDCNAYLVKTDASGVKQWDAVFGGAQYDCAWALAQTPDSGFVLAGETRSFGAGGADVYVIKTDKHGTKIK
jgi:hypothetical protein